MQGMQKLLVDRRLWDDASGPTAGTGHQVLKYEEHVNCHAPLERSDLPYAETHIFKTPISDYTQGSELPSHDHQCHGWAQRIVPLASKNSMANPNQGR